MTRNGRSLIISSVVVLAGAAAALLVPHLDYVRLVFGAPAVTLLPGWGLVVLLDPFERLGRLERFSLAVGLSLSITVLLGLVLAITPAGLTRGVWIVTLGSITLSINAVAGRSSRHAGASWPAGRLRTLPVAVAIGAIAFMSVGAVLISNSGPVPPPSGSILQLWALPHPGRTDGTVQVGVSNLISPAETYSLKVTQAGKVLAERTIVVPVGSSQLLLVRPSSVATPGEAMEAVLTTFGDAGLRRSVRVWTP